MQKFGLQRNSASQFSAIELEIVREQASALGRAGKKLRLSLEEYQVKLDDGVSRDHRSALLKSIANNVWELVLQREFVGFIDGNLAWITANYVVPKEAIALIGQHR